MEIRIDGTEKVVKLELRDEHGINWIADFVGNNSGFGPADKGQIDVDPQADWRKLATAETVEWWQNMVNAYESMEAIIAEYSGKYGGDEIAEYLQEVHAFDYDLEDQPKNVKAALEKYQPVAAQ